MTRHLKAHISKVILGPILGGPPIFFNAVGLLCTSLSGLFHIYDQLKQGAGTAQETKGFKNWKNKDNILLKTFNSKKSKTYLDSLYHQ